MITKTNCAGGESWGSGFLIGKDLIVTAAHVVEGASRIVVALNGQNVQAEILGMDRQQDYALIRTTSPISGYIFSFSGVEPKRGQQIGVFGFPLTQAFQSNLGGISGLDVSYPMASESPTHMIQIDAAVNHGNSGGPVTLIDGSVVGVAILKPSTLNGMEADRIAYAVDTTVAAPRIDAWTHVSNPVALANCPSPTPTPTASNTPSMDPNDVPVMVNSTHADAAAIAKQLALHGRYINMQSYLGAFRDFTASEQKAMGDFSDWSAGQATSRWKSLTVDEVTGIGSRVTALVTLRTNQAATTGNPQTCSIFTIAYTMLWDGSQWLIDEANNAPGHGSPKPC